ncbi:MAG: ABC transporter permease, partial [Alphaproteobacteria bacterium]
MTGGWRLPLVWTLRELRGGFHGFYVFIACLALGVGAIAAIASVSRGVEGALAAKGRELLAGDVELRLTHRPADASARDYFARHARAVSETITMRAMARNPETDKRTLVELKAVDAAYPLYGTLALAPARPLASALAQADGAWGAAIDDALAARLGLGVGDAVRVGDARLVVRAILLAEPDRGNDGFTLGPRLMIAAGALAETGLLRPGSLV